MLSMDRASVIRMVWALFASALLAPAPALADHKPPGAHLRIAGQRGVELGRLYSYDWTRPSGEPGFCVTGSADGPQRFGRAMLVKPGTRSVAIAFRTRQRPGKLEINAWRKLDEHGSPVGPSERIHYVLEARRRSGRVRAWRAEFSIPKLSGGYFIDAFGVWRDTQGCGGSEDASWTFHVRAAKPLQST